MKTISGKLVSVKPISLSKAARYISDFTSFENNGASDALSVYLNRASEAFGSLVQLQKDLKHPQSSHKKHMKKSSSHNVETVNYDDGEKKSRRRDENQGEREDKRVHGVTKEEDGSVREGGIEDMGTSKKRKDKHKKDSVKVEGSISSELRKGGEDGGSVEVDNLVNGFVDHTKEKKNKEKKKNEKSQEVLKMENEGKMVVEQGKKKKNEREEAEINERGMERNLEVRQETDSKKKKRKSVDLDGELKENSAEHTRKKPRSKV